MDRQLIQDIYPYFKDMVKKSKLARDKGFIYTMIPSITDLNAIANRQRMAKGIVAIDDVKDGIVFRAPNGSYFKKIIYTVAIIYKKNARDDQDFTRAMKIARDLFQIFNSKVLHDKHQQDKFPYLSETIQFREMEKLMLENFVGVYYLLENDEPYDLRYDPNDWIE